MTTENIFSSDHCHETDTRKKIAELEHENRILHQRLSRYEFRLYEKDSRTTGAGTGLFTRDFISSGSVVGEYTGRRAYRLLVPATGRYVMWHRNESRQPAFLHNDTYILWLVNEDDDEDEYIEGEIEVGIDAGSDTGTVLRRANSHDEPNLSMFVSNDQRVFAMALHDIDANAELFWDYHPGREKDFEIHPDHIETETWRYIDVAGNGWITLKQEVLRSRNQEKKKRRKK